ncbi:hypothetical protein IV38_GL001556 [Lactobacillus selangorensis]|uniref:Cation efflux family protein n=1 Tax=Lactobacillus selangorensis TaxID=81857 RepID=A0A0R2FSH8_9LACO|nr:hypothetical protein IV38_GL001556 [Lactobacillus selangorensis]KRN31017.1 hypothetical protein IV40_GL001659 [Lactobacillus selangorensis]
MENNAQTVRAGLRTAYFSVIWMATEFAVGLYAGLQAGSILLIVFGLDSCLEIISGGLNLAIEKRSQWRVTGCYSAR